MAGGVWNVCCYSDRPAQDLVAYNIGFLLPMILWCDWARLVVLLAHVMGSEVGCAAVLSWELGRGWDVHASLHAASHLVVCKPISYTQQWLPRG